MPVQPQPPAQAVGRPVQPPQLVCVSFSAEIVPQTTESLLQVCAQIANQGVQTVHLLISTPGGSVMHGLNAYNVLRAMPFKLVTHNVGNVDSIGNVVFLAGSKRYACPTSTFMFHGVGSGVQRDARLEEKALREKLGAVQADQKRIASVITDRSTLTMEQVHQLFLEAQTKDAIYAKENGIIHDVCDVQLPPGTPIHQLVFQR